MENTGNALALPLLLAVIAGVFAPAILAFVRSTAVAGGIAILLVLASVVLGAVQGTNIIGVIGIGALWLGAMIAGAVGFMANVIEQNTKAFGDRIMGDSRRR